MDVVLYMSTQECALSSADRVPGYEPVGQRFESSRARHETHENVSFHGFFCCFFVL